MTGASVNFKPVMSAHSAVSHADRTVPPKYLLAPKLSLGTICVLDDKGKVAQTLDAKMALASRQAKAAKNFSPVWEGVLNLPRPDLEDPKFDVAMYKKHCIEITKSWIDEYQKATNHTVLRADVHLDEGHIEDGKTLLNAHAHIISDKTNERGKVFIINRGEMRKLQDMTAKVTNLKRGQTSYETGRAHLNPTAFKAVAKSAMLESQQKVNKTKLENLQRNEKQIKDVTKKLADIHAAEIAQLKAQYDQDRADLKARGDAKQADYQALKKAHEEAQAELKATKEKVVEMDEYTKKLEAELVSVEAKLAAELVAKAEVIEAKVKSGEKSPAVLVTAEGHRDAAAKLTSQSNTMTPAPVVPLGPNARARLRAEQMALEAARTAQEPPKEQEAPIPSPKPVKTLVDRLSESMRAMLDWITGNSGKRVEINTQRSDHHGPVVQMDGLHAVQRTGRGLFAIHQLDDLDKVPALDDPMMVIWYHDGKGTVEGRTGQKVQR